METAVAVLLPALGEAVQNKSGLLVDPGGGVEQEPSMPSSHCEYCRSGPWSAILIPLVSKVGTAGTSGFIDDIIFWYTAGHHAQKGVAYGWWLGYIPVTG
jgi:hypothetical protein